MSSVAKLDPAELGAERRAANDDHLALRAWLRLLASSTQIETAIRKRLRARFGISLPRFDYLAQLHRHPDGMRMNELSRDLMVTGGNVTGLTDELEKDGYVAREADPADRRSTRVRLTREGQRAFERIAAEHERWVVELFAGLPAHELERLHALLGKLRVSVARAPESTEGNA